MSKRRSFLPQHHTIKAKVATPGVVIAPLLQQAFALHQQGQLVQAAVLYQEILQKQPNHFDALHLLGIAASQSKQPQIAVDLIGKAIQINPNAAAAHSNIGLALQDLSRNDEALASYERALAIEPDNAAVLYNHGNVLRDLKRYAEALASYERVLVIEPCNADALYNCGNALHYLGRNEEALASYDSALAIKPDHVEALNNRGVVLQALKRNEEALASYERALMIAPGHAGALYNCGNVLRELSRHEEALASYARVLLIRPDNAEVLNNRGNTLRALNRLEEALASYDRALFIEPGYADARWNESLCRLLIGDFDLGWRNYEWRWKTSELRNFHRNFTQPLWLGKESLSDKTILLHAEQGLGDTLQFCRYVRQVNALGAKVVLEVQPPLKSLLSGLSGIASIIGKGEALPAFDYHCPLLSLPLAFDTDSASIPSTHRYVTSDAKRVAIWQEKLGVKTKPRVGLVWSGSATHKNDRNRSIPFVDFVELVSRKASFYALQKEVRDADMLLAGRTGVTFVGDELDDFADTAALIELMDIVITVDTSVAHLAAAMGKAVWILLSFNPDWRWLLDREDSPWYPTARLFRQSAIGDWGSVIERVKVELQSLLACVTAN